MQFSTAGLPGSTGKLDGDVDDPQAADLRRLILQSEADLLAHAQLRTRSQETADHQRFADDLQRDRCRDAALGGRLRGTISRLS